MAARAVQTMAMRRRPDRPAAGTELHMMTARSADRRATVDDESWLKKWTKMWLIKRKISRR